jgi:hypothetical protein
VDASGDAPQLLRLVAELRSDGSRGGAGGGQAECSQRSSDGLPVEALLSVLLQLQVPNLFD